MRYRVLIGLFFLGAFLSARAQLVGSSYGSPPSIKLAPGQIVTLWVAGLNAIPSSPVNAASLPVTELAGISLKVSQLTYGMGFPLPTLAVPIFSIQQSNQCYSPYTGQPTSSAPSCLMTGVTVQLPFEMVVDPFTQPPYTTLTITQNGVAGPSWSVDTAVDNVHILTTCSGSQACITHADGTLVSANSLPVAGETLVLYLVGLGATNPLVPSGQVTPTPAPTASGFFVNLVFGGNAGPSDPGFRMNPAIGQPARVTFGGLTPGQIGLYQINLQLPASFPTIPPCGLNGNSFVASNLAINIGTVYNSHDGVAICVKP
jgi:hypothetical protein